MKRKSSDPRSRTERTATDATIVECIRSFFLQSSDFNGISAKRLLERCKLVWPELRVVLARLVSSEQITLAFASYSDNPHIKRLPDMPTAEQLERLAREDPDGICAYPSTTLLRATTDLRQYDSQPYTLSLALAKPHLTPVFFELNVLEHYFRDPRYHFRFHDYEGSLSVTTEHYQSTQMPEQHKVVLESFGIGYDATRNRVVAVFLRYLKDLSPKHQQLWQVHEMSEPCVMNSDYENAALLGGVARTSLRLSSLHSGAD